jgi:Phage tail tube protein, GTA-gp10
MSAASPRIANPARGEARLRVGGAELVVRPSFAALVAVEAELGSLFGLVERASTSRLLFHELTALFWHCLLERPEILTRDAFNEAMASHGLANLTPQLKLVLEQILQGR